MIEVFSLIDITKTGIHRNNKPQSSSLTIEEWQFKRNQQRNWDTIIQLLGLRFQPMDITNPLKLEDQRPAAYGFGWLYGPSNNISIWKFTCRYETDIDLWVLRNDFNNIPIISGLEETILFPHSCFSTVGKNLNIIISKIDL